MNTCKKAIALILSLCLLLSVFVFSAAAEETKKATELVVGTITATKVKSDDPETVLQLAIQASSGSQEAAFDSFDPNAELSIYSGAYSVLNYTEEEIEEWLIAKAKPVSYENGILTVDVYAKDGTSGAKLVSLLFDETVFPRDEGNANFIGLRFPAPFAIRFPEGLLKGSDAGSVFSGSKIEKVEIEGTVTKEIKVPSWYMKLTDTSGSKIVLAVKAMLMIMLLPVVIIVLAKDSLPTINYVMDLYGLNDIKIPISKLIHF